jgi:hypothetical protein
MGCWDVRASIRIIRDSVTIFSSITPPKLLAHLLQPALPVALELPHPPIGTVTRHQPADLLPRSFRYRASTVSTGRSAISEASGPEDGAGCGAVRTLPVRDQLLSAGPSLLPTDYPHFSNSFTNPVCNMETAAGSHHRPPSLRLSGLFVRSGSQRFDPVGPILSVMSNLAKLSGMQRQP